MKKKVVLLVCLLISAGFGGGFGEMSIATPATIDRTNIISANIPEPATDLSSLVLTSQDLPAGFIPIPPETLKNMVSGIPNFKPASVFGYLKNDNQQFQVVTGFTAQLPNQIDRAKFDTEIGEGTFAQQFSQGLNSHSKEFQFANLTALTLKDKIGEVSSGWKTQGKVQGVPINVELALFRRGKIGSFVAIMYLDGSKPPVTISEAAGQLDKRIMAVQPDVTQPQ